MEQKGLSCSSTAANHLLPHLKSTKKTRPYTLIGNVAQFPADTDATTELLNEPEPDPVYIWRKWPVTRS